jgi:hypothetical protein
MKAKKPTAKQILAIRCPTCGAAPGKKCELGTGQPRTTPHRDRRLIAQDCSFVSFSLGSGLQSRSALVGFL